MGVSPDDHINIYSTINYAKAKLVKFFQKPNSEK